MRVQVPACQWVCCVRTHACVRVCARLRVRWAPVRASPHARKGMSGSGGCGRMECGCTPDDQIVSSCREMMSSPDASTLLQPPARPPALRSYEVGCARGPTASLARPSRWQPCGESHVEGLGVRLFGKAKL